MNFLKRFVWLIIPAVLFIAGCSASTVTVTTGGTAGTPTMTATATSVASAPTATPAPPPPPPPVPTVDPGLISSCFGPGIDPSTVRQMGSVIFTADIGPLAYPIVQLPPGTSLKPYKLSGTPANNFSGSFVSGIHVDPFGKSTPYHSSLYVQICNTSTSSTHTVQAISVKLASFTPLTTSLDAWTPTPCDTTYYQNSPANVVEEGGCGGSFVDDLNLKGSFSSATPGTVIATSVGSYGSLPNSLVGHETADISLTLPSAPGIYRFAVALKIDGTATAFTGPGAAYLYAPVTHLWSGASCTNPGNLSLIPSSPAANYICP